MKEYVFKHRRNKDGKIVESRYYYGRYRLPGDRKADNGVALARRDKQVAKAKLLADSSERPGARASRAARTKSDSRGVANAIARTGRRIRERASPVGAKRKVCRGRAPRYVAGVQLASYDGEVNAAGKCWSRTSAPRSFLCLAAIANKRSRRRRSTNTLASWSSSFFESGWRNAKRERIPKNPLLRVEKDRESRCDPKIPAPRANAR